MKVKFTKLAALLLAGVALFATGCTDYEVDIQKVDKKVDNLTTEVNNKIASLEQQIAGLNATIATLETKTDHDKDIAALNKTISELETALRAALDTKVDKDVYNAKMAEIAGKIQALEAADELFKGQIQDLVTELAKKVNQTDFDEAVANLTSAINGEIKRAKEAEADLKAAIDDINDVQLPALRQRVKDIEDELPTIRKNIEDLQNGKLDKAEFDEYYKKAYEKYTKATIEAIQGAIGDLAKLKTNDKTSLVNALNEVWAKFDDYVLQETFDAFVEIAATKEELTLVQKALQGQIDGLKALIGEFPEGTTVRKYIDDKVDGLQIQINRIVDELIPALDDRVADLEDKVNNTILPQIKFAIGYESKYAGHVEGYDFANGLQGYIQDMAMDTFIAACQYADQEVAKVRDELNAFKAEMYNLLQQLASRIQSIVYVPDYDDLKITSNMAVVTQEGVDKAMYVDQPTEITYEILPAKYAAAVADNYKDLLVFDVKTVKARGGEEEADVEPAFQIMSVKKDANIDENGLVTFTVLPVNVASAQFAATDIPVEFNAVFGGLVNVWGFDVPMLFPDFERVYPVVNADDLEAYKARAAFAASLRFVCQDVDIPTDPASEEYNEVASTYNVLFPAVTNNFNYDIYKPGKDDEGKDTLVPIDWEEHQELPYSSLRSNPVGEKKNQDPKGYRVIQDGAVPVVIIDNKPYTIADARNAGYVVPDATIAFEEFTYDKGKAQSVDEENFVETAQVYAEIEMNPDKSAAERKAAIGNVITGNYTMTTLVGVTPFSGEVEITPALGEVSLAADIVWTWKLDAVIDHNLFYPNEQIQDDPNTPAATEYTRVKYPIEINAEEMKYLEDNLAIGLANFAHKDPVEYTITYVQKADPDDPDSQDAEVDGKGIFSIDALTIENGKLFGDFSFAQDAWGKEFTVVAKYDLTDAVITVTAKINTFDRYREKVQIVVDPHTFIVNGDEYVNGYYQWSSDPLHKDIFFVFDDKGVINVDGNVEGDFEYDADQDDFNEGELEGKLRMAKPSGTAAGYIDFNRNDIQLNSMTSFTPAALASDVFSTGKTEYELKKEADPNDESGDPNLWIGKQVTRNVTTFIGEEVEVVMQFNYKVPDYNFLHLSVYTFNSVEDDYAGTDMVPFRQHYDLPAELFIDGVTTPYDEPTWWTQVQPSYFTTAKGQATEAEAQTRLSNRYALYDYDVQFINLAELAFNVVDDKDQILKPADLEALGLTPKFAYRDASKLNDDPDYPGLLPMPDQLASNGEFTKYEQLWVAPTTTTFYYLTNEHPWIPAEGTLTLNVGGKNDDGTLADGAYDFPVATRFQYHKPSVKYPEVDLDYTNYAMVRWTPFREPVADGYTMVLDENKIYSEPLFKGMFLKDRRLNIPEEKSFYVIEDGKWVEGNASEDATAATENNNGYMTGVNSKDAYHIKCSFDYSKVELPAELQRLLSIKYSDDNGQTFYDEQDADETRTPYVVFDYRSEVQFRGTVNIPVIVKLENPWQEVVTFRYNFTIKGVVD